VATALDRLPPQRVIEDPFAWMTPLQRAELESLLAEIPAPTYPPGRPPTPQQRSLDALQALLNCPRALDLVLSGPPPTIRAQSTVPTSPAKPGQLGAGDAPDCLESGDADASESVIAPRREP
jgi:hypothetical protein